MQTANLIQSNVKQLWLQAEDTSTHAYMGRSIAAVNPFSQDNEGRTLIL